MSHPQAFGSCLDIRSSSAIPDGQTALTKSGCWRLISDHCQVSITQCFCQLRL